MNQQQQQEHLHSLNLKQNAGYHILDETQNAAIGFSPTAPDKIVIWNRDSDGDYISGHYGSTMNLSETNDLLFRGFDMDKVTGILNDIGFDYNEVEKITPLSMVKSLFIQETKDLIGDVEKWLDSDSSYLSRNSPVEKNIIERAMKLQGASYVLSPIIGENTHDKIVAAANYIYPRAIDVNALNTATDFIWTIEEFGETYQDNNKIYEQIRTRLSLEVYNLMAAVREWDNSDARHLSLDTDHIATNDVSLKAMQLRGASDILAPLIGSELNEKIFKSTENVNVMDFESSAMRDIITEIEVYDMSKVAETSVANVPPSNERKFNSIELPNYTNTWSSVGEMQVGIDTYYLMENDVYGDETQYLILDGNQNVITDDVYNGFEEPEFVEYLENIAADEAPAFVHHPIDIEQSSVNEIIEDLQKNVAEEQNKSNNTIQIKSIVTQTYESDPVSHRITSTYTRTGAEVFGELEKGLEAHGLIPDEYFLPNFDEKFMLPEDALFEAHTDFGGSEGIYIDITLIGGERPQRFATGKTLDDTADAFMKMSHIAAVSQLLLNGNGKEYELTQEKGILPQKEEYSIDPSKKTIYVCSPLAGKIQENIAKAREYSKFVAQQGGTPIAPHITEIFNDLIPEERELGLAMGIDYLRKADELWVFGDIISNGMSAEIIIAQRDLQIPVFHVDDKTYEKVLFNEYKALQPTTQNTNNKEVFPMAENFTRDQLNRAKDVDILNYVQTHGYTVKAHGTCYKLIEDGHDSTVIFPSTNSWSSMASGIGGDIVSFLVKHEGKDMVSAVKELIGETFDPQKMFDKSKESVLSREPLVLPPKAADNRRVYAYLLQTRGLDRNIVHQAIHDGNIYQSKETISKGDKEYIFNNCIFVGKDDAGTAQYASQRSMNDNSTFNFKQDVKNSNKAFGFKLPGKATADWLTVCEAPIDALSIASLNKLKGLSTDDEHILSLGGVSDKAIDKYLESNKNINVINICLDNDEAGRTAGEKIKEKYSALGYKIVESYPKEKDYNLELKKAIEVKNTPVADAPDKAENNRRAFMYLTGTKMLDEDLIKARISDGTVYQSDREVQKINGDLVKHANMVFVQRGKNGSVIYAIEISQNANLDKADFKIEYKNDSQAGNYLSRVGENSTLLVFSNPISLLSYQTAAKDVGLIPKSNYLCCITNQAEAISEFIEQNPRVKSVQVMLDKASVLSHKTNQLVDYREFAFKKIKKELGEKGISVSKKYPQGIDWNKDMLLLKQQSAQAKKAAATNKNKEQGRENER